MMKKPEYVYLSIEGVEGRVEINEPSTGNRAIIVGEGGKVKALSKDLSLIRRAYKNVELSPKDTGPQETVLGE